LGVRLGAVLAVTVVLVLGALTIVQWRQDTERLLLEHQRQLLDSLAPLANDIEAATSVERMAELIAGHQRSREGRGHRDRELELRDAAGKVVIATPGAGRPRSDRVVHAVEPVRSGALAGGSGELHAWQDAAHLEAHSRQSWRDRWIKILVAALTIIAAAQVAIYTLVGRPLNRLVHSLGQLEGGYLGPPVSARAPWEVRLLDWRLRRTAEELQGTVRRLVEAERRALLWLPRDAPARPRPANEAAATAPRIPGSSHRDRLLLQYLEDLQRLLDSSPAGDPAAAAAAQEVWERAAVEAQRIGAMELRVRLENAALRTLEPDAHRDLTRRVRRLTGTRRTWVEERARRIERILADEGIEVEALQHRVKHVAGVWRKMQEKQLELDEVSDLFAFRVIFADEQACYAALGVLHREFEPQPFRFKDYIERPKANGYRSIHTSVRDDDGVVFEIQIRTREMHELAEAGAAAHWVYRAARPKPRPGGWLRRWSG
jgi:hypothetical protein